MSIVFEWKEREHVLYLHVFNPRSAENDSGCDVGDG